jgi:RNA polymerase sigma factor (sigma-70 family)
MTEDQRLLLQYQRHGSKPALEDLIRRHLALVYSSAMRQVRDAHLAEDVTQAVFMVLTQKARTIRNGVAVSGWLLAVTRRAAVNAMRKESAQRRQQRSAAKPESEPPGDDADWLEIASRLDEAVNDLPTIDRDAIVLRFFQDRTFADVGMTLRVSEEAARKRVNRALVRLRKLLALHGITEPAIGLGAALLANAVTPVPLHIVQSIAPANANPQSISIAKEVIHMMTQAKITAMTLVAAATLLIGGGVAIVMNLTSGQQLSPVPNTPAVQAPVQNIPHSFTYSGTIVDQQGNPIPNVKVTAGYYLATGGMGYIDVVSTNQAGRFHINRPVALSGASPKVTMMFPVRLSFDHSDFIHTQLEDINQLPATSQTDLHITLRPGNTVNGKAVDPSGNPVANALVEATFGEDSAYAHMTTTGADGEFTLRGLPHARADIRLLSITPGSPVLSGHISIVLGMGMAEEPAPLDDAGFPLKSAAKSTDSDAATQPAVVTLQAVDYPVASVHHLFGMKLADVDFKLADELFLSTPRGVVVLDPGNSTSRLKIGTLQRGDHFWMVGPHKISNFDDMVQRMIDGCRAQQLSHPAAPCMSVRVVYSFVRPGQSGSDTEYMSLSKKDLADLLAVKQK